MRSKTRSVCAAVAAIAALGLAAFVTATNLIESYGSGPPYYGRTANMDKWESPLRFLLIVDAVALLVLIGLWRFARKPRQ